jgi:hypothetical protein
MPLAADHPFLEVLGTIFIFFLFVGWFGLLIVMIGDVFSRHDIRGGKKVLWLLLLIFVPFIGVFAYVIVNSEGMAQRRADRALRDYVRREQLE